MSKTYDPWYVRLPDGRVIKAKSTASVRYHVMAGQIAPSSFVRRDKQSEWVALAWTSEFNDLSIGKAGISIQDLAPPSSKSKPELENMEQPESLQLETIGVRGILEELYAAFDGTMRKSKLVWAGFLFGLICVVQLFFAVSWGKFASAIGISGTYAELFGFYAWNFLSASLLAGISIAWFARQMNWELSRMVPISMAQAREKSAGICVQSALLTALAGLTIALGVGAVRLALTLLPKLGLPGFVTEIAEVFGFVLLLALFFQAWTLFLLLPIPAVEDYTVSESIGIWWKLRRQHFGRIILFEGLAMFAALLATLPFVLAFFLASAAASPTVLPGMTKGSISLYSYTFLYGLTLGPAFLFMIIANVVLYLKLRYDFLPTK